MARDRVKSVGIDADGRLYVEPETQRLDLIYREAAGVHWDVERRRLYSAVPRKWTYLEWFDHIVATASKGNVILEVRDETLMVNMPDELAAQIRQRSV